MGGGIGMGNTCKPMAVSFQCMTKFTTKKNDKKKIVLLKDLKSYLIRRILCRFHVIVIKSFLFYVDLGLVL